MISLPGNQDVIHFKGQDVRSFFFFFLAGGNWITSGFVKFGAAASRTPHSHPDRGDRSHEIFRVLNFLSAK